MRWVFILVWVLNMGSEVFRYLIQKKTGASFLSYHDLKLQHLESLISYLSIRVIGN